MTSLLAVAFCVASQVRADETTGGRSYMDETRAQRDARMEWFREARFGMFIQDRKSVV